MLRRTSLERRTPMRRTWMRRGRRRNKYARRERAFEYLAWIHTLPCMVTMIGAYDDEVGGLSLCGLPCSGPIQADHAGERIAGMGTKSRDRDCISVCLEHHSQITEYRGLFADKAFRKRWRTAAIAATHELAQRNGIVVPEC